MHAPPTQEVQAPHAPHEPPQPSSPQTLPVQVGHPGPGESGGGGGEVSRPCFLLCFFLWCLAVAPATPSRLSPPPSRPVSAPRRERGAVNVRTHLSNRSVSMGPLLACPSADAEFLHDRSEADPPRNIHPSWYRTRCTESQPCDRPSD